MVKFVEVCLNNSFDFSNKTDFKQIKEFVIKWLEFHGFTELERIFSDFEFNFPTKPANSIKSIKVCSEIGNLMFFYKNYSDYEEIKTIEDDSDDSDDEITMNGNKDGFGNNNAIKHNNTNANNSHSLIILPCKSLSDQWDSLVFESDIKQRLTSYIYTTCILLLQ